MKYVIHNEKVIRNKRSRDNALKVIDKQVERLGRFVEQYPKPLTLDIYFNQYNKTTYIVSAFIKLKEGVVYVKDKGTDLPPTIYLLFNKLRIALNKRINKERKEYLYKRKDRRFEAVMEYAGELKQYKKDHSKELFHELLKVLLSDVARYIRRRMKSAEMTTAVKKGKFKVQEILDELYLMAYDRLNEVPGNGGINTWLYQLADEVLDKHLKEIEFEQSHLEQLSKIVDQENKDMDEQFTIDAEEEIIPLEELDDYSQQIGMYHANELFTEDDENSILDELTYQYNKKDIHNFIEKELLKFPVYKRNIMDLYLLHQMTIADIAEIKRMTSTEIEAVIAEVGYYLRRKLSILV